jgi:thiol-disulfide isomerase/thioredoxin
MKVKMKTFFKLTMRAFIVFALSFTIVSAQPETKKDTVINSIPIISAQSETKEEAVINSIDDVKTIEDVGKYIKQVQLKSLNSRTAAGNKEEKRNEATKYVSELGEALIKRGEKIIATTDDPAQQVEGAKIKIQGLKFLRNTHELEKYFDELAKEGKYKSIVEPERYKNLFLIKASKELRENFTLENLSQYTQEAKKWANTEGIEPARPLLVILNLAVTPKALELDPDIVKKTVDEFLVFVRSDELKVSEDKKKDAILQIEGFQKRLLGANPELYGKTLDDQDFDWIKLRGKYVLIKFTASWCGPCKGEIPFMLKAYEKYHDKGFEIVSVYVRDKLDATKKIVEEEKLNWIILSEELTEKAGLPKQGTSYAIQGVPTMLLADKEGNIISTTVRGAKLEETLAKLFGETETKNQDTTSDNTAKK